MFRLKEIRTKRGLTQQNIADILQITRAAYTNIENGRRDPDTKTLQALASYYDVSIDYILGRTEDPSSPTKDTTDESEELNELLQEAKDRPEIHALFSLAKDASKEDVEKTIDIIKVLRKSNDHTDY